MENIIPPVEQLESLKLSEESFPPLSKPLNVVEPIELEIEDEDEDVISKRVPIILSSFESNVEKFEFIVPKNFNDQSLISISLPAEFEFPDGFKPVLTFVRERKPKKELLQTQHINCSGVIEILTHVKEDVNKSNNELFSVRFFSTGGIWYPTNFIQNILENIENDLDNKFMVKIIVHDGGKFHNFNPKLYPLNKYKKFDIKLKRKDIF